MCHRETNRQSEACLNAKKPKYQKVRIQKSRVKTEWTAFFMLNASIIRHEFVTKKQTVNSKFYEELVKRFVARVQRFRPQFQENGSWYILPYDA
jgi:hypothetical protein